MRTFERAAALAAALSCVMMSATPVLADPRDGNAQRASRQSSRQTQSQARDQVSIVLESVTPKSAQPTDKVQITGTVQNRSGAAINGLSVRFRYSGQHVTSRGQLAQFAASQPSSILRGAPTGSASVRALPQAAAANGKQAFKVGFTTRQMGLGQFGVYPVGVEVYDASGRVLGGQTTFITYVPAGRQAFTPVKVAWIWPIVSGIHRANDETFIDDQLAKEVAPGGRLTNLVNVAAQSTTPLTWAIDPAVLDDAQAMNAKGGYSLMSGRKKTTKRPQNAVGVNWTRSLKEASKSEPLFNLPYADPDAVALVRYKLGAHLNTAYKNANEVTTATLQRPPDAQMAWPPSGSAGRGTLNQLAKSAKLSPKSGAFVMSSRDFPVQTVTPSATTTVPTDAGAMRAVVYDEGLSDIISGDSRSPGADTLIEQRFLAETAMITAEAPELPRTLVVAPNRRWDPSPELAYNLLKYSATAKWLDERTPLGGIAQARPVDRPYAGYSNAYERYELGKNYLAEVQDIARRAVTFRSILNPPVNTYERGVLRMESSYWRSRYSRSVRARDELDRGLKDDMDGLRVVLPANKRISLAGTSGRNTVTIANDLRGRKVRFRVVFTSQSPGLRIGRLRPADEGVIALDPGKKIQIRIPLQASGNGNFKMVVQLMTPTGERGRVYGQPAEITVRSTEYGRVALLITGGALAVLFVGVGVRAMRARRRRKAEAAGDGSTGVGPAGTTGPQGSGFPGDGSGYPAESAFPSGPEFPGGTGLHSGPGFDREAGPRSDSDRWEAGSGLGREAGSASGPGATSGTGSAAGSGFGREAGFDGPSGPDGESGPGPRGTSGPGGSGPSENRAGFTRGSSGDGPSAFGRWDGNQS
ncbi:DUF6049 family protein [Actinomadura rudentiformis]|uniref:DUF6049 family protein n=1 Tax=Actinomadura rudentiformis TaxID=359158 RepID=UPI00178C556E|nr:DUF6049 family protein [Actinomadura rudentiformis]